VSDKYTVGQLVEIRAAAIEEYKHATPAGAEVYADGLVSRLTRPAIHPDVPVMYDDPTFGVVDAVWKHGEASRAATNVRVLIPAPLVKEWVKWWGSHPAGLGICGHIAEKIAHYTEHGHE